MFYLFEISKQIIFFGKNIDYLFIFIIHDDYELSSILHVTSLPIPFTTIDKRTNRIGNALIQKLQSTKIFP